MTMLQADYYNRAWFKLAGICQPDHKNLRHNGATTLSSCLYFIVYQLQSVQNTLYLDVFLHDLLSSIATIK